MAAEGLRPNLPPKNHVDGQWRAEKVQGRWTCRMRVGPFHCVIELQADGQWWGRVSGFGGLLAYGAAASRLQGMQECEAACARVATHVLEVLGSSAQHGRRHVGA